MIRQLAASQDAGPAFAEQVDIAKKYTAACGYMWLLTAEWEGYSLVQPEHLHPKAQPVPVQPLPPAKKKRFDDEDQVDDAMFDLLLLLAWELQLLQCSNRMAQDGARSLRRHIVGRSVSKNMLESIARICVISVEGYQN